MQLLPMNRQEISSYFATLQETEQKLGVNCASKIWNMDESGFHLEHVPQRVVSRKGNKSVPGRVSSNRENITVVACTSAAGNCMPPLIIVKGKTYKSLLSFATDEGPTGASWTWQEKAWQEDVLGNLWFRNVFLKNCGSERPQLLIMDQHHSHEVLLTSPIFINHSHT